MSALCDALGPIVGPRLSLEALGGRGVAMSLDGGAGGTAVTRAAPWLPAVSLARDLRRTAQGVAAAVHWMAMELGPGLTRLGPSTPQITSDRDRVRVQFFGLDGEPLPIVEVPLQPHPA